MKKLSRDRKMYLYTRCLRQQRLQHLRRSRAKRRLLRDLATRRRFARMLKVVIRAPESIMARIDSHRDELLTFISRVNRELKSGKSVHVDLRKTENFHPCGTLMFLSRLDIWMAQYPGKLTGSYPANQRSEELLQHVGALAALGLPPRCTITHENVKFWHYYSGTIGDAAIYQPLTQAVLETIDHPQGLLFGDCLNEAVSNTLSHAYGFEMKGLPAIDQRKWWMLSEVKNDEVFVAIYDWGVSIPESLRRKPELMDFLRLRRWKDARLIEAAATSLRTSTRLPHRGKGLPEMVEFSKNLASGGLSISSGMGSYIYHAESNEFKRHRFTCRMPGTLVLWKLPFREEHHADDKNDLDR